MKNAHDVICYLLSLQSMRIANLEFLVLKEANKSIELQDSVNDIQSYCGKFGTRKQVSNVLDLIPVPCSALTLDGYAIFYNKKQAQQMTLKSPSAYLDLHILDIAKKDDWLPGMADMVLNNNYEVAKKNTLITNREVATIDNVTRIYKSYKQFAEQTNSWLNISELAYYQARN